MGEGWTGSFGTGRLDQSIRGHDDEEDPDLPIRIFDGPVKDVSLGWGHTGIITSDDKLLLAGRPHDFSALLRLSRLPKVIRDYSVRSMLESTRGEERTLQPASLVGSVVTWLSEHFLPDQSGELWERARDQSILDEFREIELPAKPHRVHCSAGYTAVQTEDGKVYMFGLNHFGQCGVGATSNNQWDPALVTGLTTDFADVPRNEMEQSYPIEQVSLGLQHAVCLNTEGELFAWGKGERGQLGQEIQLSESHTAMPIRKALTHVDAIGKPTYQKIGKVIQISCGLLHSAALDDNNQVMLWGKHVLSPLPTDKGSLASDARVPVILEGLPDKRVVQIECGSHHTSVLMEDGSVYAVGVSSDTKVPMLTPVELIPPGFVQMPVKQFSAHMDRTTIVPSDGSTVHQVHLWEDESLQEYAIFTPTWIDRLLEEESLSISQVHRSWMHSVVVTDP